MSSQPNGTDVACVAQDGSRTCLTRKDTAGLTMQAAASLLSLGSILYTFAFIMLQNIIRRGSFTKIRIFYYPMDILIFSLLFADCLQAIGGLLSLKWIQDGIVEIGPFCNAQGILKVFGETGVAFSTLVIAICTFVTVLTGRELSSMRITGFIVVLPWVFIAILVGVGYGTSKATFISPAPFWCWVHSTAWRLATEYVWMWIALFASLLLYVPLFLWIRGNLVSSRRKALVMLVYPAFYCLCIIPLSVVRWITFMEEAKYGASTMPPAATFAVITIFCLSGFFNVVLTFTTRPNLGLFGR